MCNAYFYCIGSIAHTYTVIGRLHQSKQCLQFSLRSFVDILPHQYHVMVLKYSKFVGFDSARKWVIYIILTKLQFDNWFISDKTTIFTWNSVKLYTTSVHERHRFYCVEIFSRNTILDSIQPIWNSEWREMLIKWGLLCCPIKLMNNSDWAHRSTHKSTASTYS